MKRRTKFLISTLAALLIVPSITYAEDTIRSYSKNVTIHYGLKVTMGGTPVDLIDSNGKIVNAFIYEDTAYVPVKTLAPILGGLSIYHPENNSIDLYNGSADSYVNGYIAALTGTEISDVLSKKIMDRGYTPIHLKGNYSSNKSDVNTNSRNTEISGYDDFFLKEYLDNYDTYSDLAKDYYNMGIDRMEEINNGTATNNEAWQAMYDSMGKLLENMGQLPELPNNSMNKNTNYTFPLHLYSNDGKVYLGKCVTDEYDDESIWYGLELAGDYSSPYGTNSIWNKYGEYGGTLISYSNSAFNDRADTPPIIVDDKGVFVAYLTTNDKIENGWTITELRQFVVNNNQ